LIIEGSSKHPTLHIGIRWIHKERGKTRELKIL